MDRIADSTPIVAGVGQCVERGSNELPPVEFAARAAAAAIADAGGRGLAAAIDTIAVSRFFCDSVPMWASPFGRSNNPPESVARRIGARPRSRIYTSVGGNEPQSRLIEFAHDIARGERECVLLTGAEAIRNERHARRAGRELDWSEHHDVALEERDPDLALLSPQEIANGLMLPIDCYSLIEQARASALGRSVAAQREHMGRLWAAFAAIAAHNPMAQFPVAPSADEILAATPLTHLYTRRMVAQDGVNQGAAVLLTSVARARTLGIAPERWVFLHGLAEGREPLLSERPDPGNAPVAGAVLARALALAGIGIDDIDPIDVYSCFPCAVSMIAEHLGIVDDGSRALTLTGGLPFFGGPGNNYTTHAIAEMVQHLRRTPQAFGLVTANGGIFSKHAAGIYSCRPSTVDWGTAATRVDGSQNVRRRIAATRPSEGRIVCWTIACSEGAPSHGMIIAGTDGGERFTARTAPGDQATIAALLDADRSGMRVRTAPAKGETLHFTLEQND